MPIQMLPASDPAVRRGLAIAEWAGGVRDTYDGMHAAVDTRERLDDGWDVALVDYAPSHRELLLALRRRGLNPARFAIVEFNDRITAGGFNLQLPDSERGPVRWRPSPAWFLALASALPMLHAVWHLVAGVMGWPCP